MKIKPAKVLVALLAGVLVLVALSVTLKLARREWANARCAHNLGRIASALELYVTEYEAYPLMSKVPGTLMFAPEALYPKYIADRAPIDAKSYYYLGYLVFHERSGLAWIDAYKESIRTGRAIPDHREVWSDCATAVEVREKEFKKYYESEMAKVQGKILPGYADKPYPSDPTPVEECLFVRLRMRCEQAIVSYMPVGSTIGNPNVLEEAKALVPIIFERPELHGDGGHVLYMDGHIELVPYPGKFPMTQKFIEGLQSLNELEK